MLDLIPPQTRVLGLGELHVRSDRTPARSALSVFTDEVMPAIADRVSDLVLETWIVDKKCQAKGAAASKRIEQAMKRPAETQRELGTGIGRVSGAGVKVHALRMTCADYDVVAPEIGGIQAEALLSLVTRELGRVTSSAVAYRDKRAKEVPRGCGRRRRCPRGPRGPELVLARWGAGRRPPRGCRGGPVRWR
jgi:hypothetical protein